MREKRTLADIESLDFDPRKTPAYAEANLAANLGDLIRSARLARGTTQSDVASAMNSKQSAVARLEGGANIPTIETLIRIAGALGQFFVIGVLDEGEIKEAGLLDMVATGRVAFFPRSAEDEVRAASATSDEDGVGLAERFFGREDASVEEEASVECGTSVEMGGFS